MGARPRGASAANQRWYELWEVRALADASGGPLVASEALSASKGTATGDLATSPS